MNAAEERQAHVLDAFRSHYRHLERRVQDAIAQSVDSNILDLLREDVAELLALVQEHHAIFSEEEFHILTVNLAAMLNDTEVAFRNALDSSHHGRPEVIRHIHSGGRGRPAIWIDPTFLRWAYTLRSISGIAAFLGVSRTVVRNAVLEHGIATPQSLPQPLAEYLARRSSASATIPAPTATPSLTPTSIPALTSDPILDPLEDSSHLPVTSFTGPLTHLSDDDLDGVVIELRRQFVRLGVTMLDGMLRAQGIHVTRDRINASLRRVDPVHRIFDRIRIRRRTYRVAGPNSLWHHDGQHGLIRWRIVIHGFIDGYSRLIVGLRAHNNNRAESVLGLFLNAAETYGIPSRVRGDHGLENLFVAAYMESVRGCDRGSYIWGRSVHNVRIERLWADVTNQLGATWASRFTNLEVHHGLNVNNERHMWLLHFLFLPIINQQLDMFVNGWNQHRIQVCHGPNRSPADMFGFDMLANGVRGDALPQEEEDLSQEELEVFGVDWEGLQEEMLLRSRDANNDATEPAGSWLGNGAPDHLNIINVDEPTELDIGLSELTVLSERLQSSVVDDAAVQNAWLYALGLLRATYPDF